MLWIPILGATFVAAGFTYVAKVIKDLQGK